jgi:hypothetical protein
MLLLPHEQGFSSPPSRLEISTSNGGLSYFFMRQRGTARHRRAEDSKAIDNKRIKIVL